MTKEDAINDFRQAVRDIEMVNVFASATEWKALLLDLLEPFDRDDRERLMQIMSARTSIPLQTVERWYSDQAQAKLTSTHKSETASMQKAFDNWWIGYSQSEPTEADKDSRKYLLMFTAFRAGWVSGRSMTG